MSDAGGRVSIGSTRRARAAVRASAVAALAAATASGAALAQGAPAPGGGDGRWSVSAEALVVWFKGSPTPVPVITDNYLDVWGFKRTERNVNAVENRFDELLAQ